MEIPPISESRYWELHEISDKYNFDLVSLNEYLIQFASYYGRFAGIREVDALSRDAYDSSGLTEYDPMLIENWHDMVRYMLMYLFQRISKTVFYDGAYNTETLYILNPLIDINTTGIITLDSEPGFFISENPYDIRLNFLQLPYVQLVGKKWFLERIVQEVLSLNNSYMTPFMVEDKIIKDYNDVLIRKLPNLELREQFGSLYLGVIPPKSQNLFGNFLEYIFTDQLFKDIINLIDRIMIACINA